MSLRAVAAAVCVAVLVGSVAAVPGSSSFRGALDAVRFAGVGSGEGAGLFPSSDCSKKTVPWGATWVVVQNDIGQKQRYPRLMKKALQFMLAGKTCFDFDVYTEKVSDEAKFASKAVKMCSKVDDTITIRTPFVFVREKLLKDAVEGKELTVEQAVGSEIICKKIAGTSTAPSCKDEELVSLAAELLTPEELKMKVVVEPLTFNGRLVIAHHGNKDKTLAGYSRLKTPDYVAAIAKLPQSIRDSTKHIFLLVCWAGLGTGTESVAALLGEQLKPHFTAVKDIVAPQYPYSVTSEDTAGELQLSMVEGTKDTTVFQLTVSKWLRFPRWAAFVLTSKDDTNKATCMSRNVPFVLKSTLKSSSILCRLRKLSLSGDTVKNVPRTWKTTVAFTNDSGNSAFAKCASTTKFKTAVDAITA